MPKRAFSKGGGRFSNPCVLKIAIQPTPTPIGEWRQLRPITANYVIGATVLAQGLGDRLSFPLLIDRYSSELLQVMYR